MLVVRSPGGGLHVDEALIFPVCVRGRGRFEAFSRYKPPWQALGRWREDGGRDKVLVLVCLADETHSKMATLFANHVLDDRNLICQQSPR